MKRNYQINPQSEEELKTVRAREGAGEELPDIVRGEEPKIISVNPNSIMGLVYCEEELKDLASEEYQHRKLRKENREAAVLNMMSSPEATDQPSPDIDSILKSIFEFNLNDVELGALKNKLSGKPGGYLSLCFVGTKTKLLYPELKKLNSELKKLTGLKVHRRTIAHVFASCVEWKQSHHSRPEKLDENLIYKKI